MLGLRPNCELCDTDLPPDSPDARICSYECTFCARCVADRLGNVCPTCGGNFAPRPIRPRRAWREGLRLGLGNDPAGTERRHCRWTEAEIAEFRARLGAIDPASR